ncbi:MAG: hypothetical protein ACYCW6_07330 [Candidatus Xenobia bacterium]
MQALLIAILLLATKAFPVALPGTADILKMGYVGFDAWAQQHVPDLTDAQRDYVADTYNKLRRQRNQQTAAALPDTDRVNLQIVTRLLDAWRDARIAHAVSGTPHSLVRERAGTADLLGTCIAQWDGPARPDAGAPVPTGDRREARLLKQLETELHKLPPAPRALVSQYVAHEAAAWH